MKKTIILSLSITLSLGVMQAHAGKYVLEPLDVRSYGTYTTTPDNVKNICQLYLKEVIEYNNHKPMVCERTFNPKAHQFSRPEWKKLDTEEAIEYLKKTIYYSVSQNLSLKNNPEKRAKVLNQRLKKGYEQTIQGEYIYQAAKFDIDNDGSPDKVLRMFDSNQVYGCSEKKEVNWTLGNTSGSYVVFDKNNEVDEMKTRSIVLYYGIMQVNGYSYFDRWAGTNVREKTDGVITVYEPAKVPGVDGDRIAVMPVCKFKYYK